ncbi:aminopeptidase N [Aurantivibrio plasticivorans]
MRDASPQAIHLKDYKPTAFLITSTHLTIDLGEENTRVTSTLEIVRNCSEDAPEDKNLCLHSGGLCLDAISLDGKALGEADYELTNDSLCVRDVPESFSLVTTTTIKPQENTTLEGLYKSQKMFCTQCEAEGFRNITFYLDRPDVMSEFTTKIIGDKTRYPVLLSNGNLIGEGDFENGRHWKEWHDPFKKPCYLFAMVAGDLSVVRDSFTTMSGRNVRLEIFVEKKDLDKCDHAMRSLKNAMKWDEEVYGREYDLDIFMIVAVDDFNMGAMENKGLNIFNTSCVLAKPEVTTDLAFQRVEAVVAHEYFHNWSGNRVTCRDWFQLSLKEGFTVFRDAEFSADMGSPVVKRIEDVTLLRTAQFAEDAGPMSHPIQPSSFIEISNFYTLTIYEKGAEVVRMIYNLLGKELFRQGSDLYFSRHDGQAVTINEFTAAMEEVSGRDLTQFKRWYTQAGTPSLMVSDHYDVESETYSLIVKQSLPETPDGLEKLPQHIPVAIGLIGSDGEINTELKGTDAGAVGHHVLEVTEAEQRFEFNGVTEKPVPSLLRNFSAPIRLHYDYSRDDLVRLIQNDTDGFVRWDAMQQLGEQVIDELVASYPDTSSVEIDSRLIEACRAILNDTSMDSAMAAHLLSLPSEASLSEKASLVKVDAIHAARSLVRQKIAAALQHELEATYQRLDLPLAYEPSAEQIALRSLKNVVLGYLSLLPADKHLDRCISQYHSANNMTDTLAALSAVVNSEHPGASEQAGVLLDSFYQRFANEALAVDQWLAIQAGCQKQGALNSVMQLMQHDCFEMTNPNKLRSVIGVFCNQNLVNFHHADGSGYEFLADQIMTLNAQNPQIAARLLTPLTRWRKYDDRRQQHMIRQLQRIKALPNLSKDVYEVVSKSLPA